MAMASACGARAWIRFTVVRNRARLSRRSLAAACGLAARMAA